MGLGSEIKNSWLNSTTCHIPERASCCHVILPLPPSNPLDPGVRTFPSMSKKSSGQLPPPRDSLPNFSLMRLLLHGVTAGSRLIHERRRSRQPRAVIPFLLRATIDVDTNARRQCATPSSFGASVRGGAVCGFRVYRRWWGRILHGTSLAQIHLAVSRDRLRLLLFFSLSSPLFNHNYAN